MAFLFSAPAFAATLEAEFTWDTTNWGMHFWVDAQEGFDRKTAYSYVTWGGAAPNVPCGGDGHPETFSSITNGLFTQVPCGGRGPVKFVLNPTSPIPLQFIVWMQTSGWDYDLVNGPNGAVWALRPPTPTNFTMILRLDGVELTRTNFTLVDWGGSHLVFSYTPEATEVKFDILDAAPANDRRILLTNPRDTNNLPYRPYPWFQRLLSRDSAIGIGLRTYVNGVPTSGIPVTLRVVDPPDPSQYIVGVPGGQPSPGAALSHDGDNIGALPPLVGAGITVNGDGTYSATSGAEGYVFAELQLDATARPGDNYQIEGVFDGVVPTRSGVITAWRRMFVEKRTMFRRGHLLVNDAPPGTWHLVVPDAEFSTAGGNFAANDNVVLQHAPPHGLAKTESGGYYQTYTRIAAATSFTSPTTSSTAGVGTIALTTGSSSIIGSGTRFDRLVAESATSVGSVINVASRRFVVLAINSKTQITVSPASDTTGANLPYSIGDTHLRPSTSYVRLTLNTPLDKWYGPEPLVMLSTGVITLNDAIAKLNGAGSIGTTDYFDSDESKLVGAAESWFDNAMQAAYAEYIALRFPMPLPRVILSKTGASANYSQWFIDRWFSTPVPVGVGPDPDPMMTTHYVPPVNHQLLLVADTNPDVGRDVGQTYSRPAPYPPETATALFRGQIELETASNTSPLYGQNADAILSKIEVHEIAHQWLVNGGLPGHCNRVAYDSQGAYPTPQTPPAAPAPNVQFCAMAVDANLAMPAPWNPLLPISQTTWQYGNGHIAFHMTQTANGWDSEYLTIRRAPDPWQP